MPKLPAREGYERMRKRLHKHQPELTNAQRTKIAQDSFKRLDRRRKKEGKGRSVPEL